MTELQKNISNFLDDFQYMKGLSDKTLKAYTIDLRQFSDFVLTNHGMREKCLMST